MNEKTIDNILRTLERIYSNRYGVPVTVTGRKNEKLENHHNSGSNHSGERDLSYTA